MTAAPQNTAAVFEKQVRDFFSRPEAGQFTVEHFAPMEDGHAGYTFGIDLRDRSGLPSRYVLKVAPTGVRRSGSTDIFRQAALLDALHEAGLPVPEVRWSSAGEEELGAPFIVMARLAGRSYIIWEPDPVFASTPASLPHMWVEGASALARIHRIDHRSVLEGWEEPTSLAAELDRWSALIRHSEDPIWVEMLDELSARLRLSMPCDAPVGLIHGDFQPGNILFAGGKMRGIIDWDLAAIGPQGMDMGWYLMMADADNWDAAWRPIGVAPRADIIAAYAEAGGPALDDLKWHQAFAQFRLGAIAGLNLKLHRTARRVDPTWERFAMSIPSLLRSGLALLGKKVAA
jgi:aminoglycoside phosphotransferase (APT) family kinase protein